MMPGQKRLSGDLREAALLEVFRGNKMPAQKEIPFLTVAGVSYRWLHRQSFVRHANRVVFERRGGCIVLLGYADSPDAQRVVSSALDAAPVLARYPPADELARGRSLGRRRGLPALCGC